MTLPFVPGRLSAAKLRARLPVIAACPADIAIVNFTGYSDVPGLAVYLEANRVYALDGYIAYTASGAGAVKIALLAPPNTGMNWSIFPLAAGSESDTGIGNIEGIGKRGWGDAIDQGAAGGAAVWAPLSGLAVTSRWPGVLQVRFAQINANNSATMIRAGSWIRAERIA